MIRIGNKEGHQEWMVLDWGIRGLGDNLSPLEAFTAPPSWTASASCAGVDDDFWIQGEGHTTSDTDEVARLLGLAKKYCWECPVVDRCQADSTKDEKFYSIRGGRLPKGVK